MPYHRNQIVTTVHMYMGKNKTLPQKDKKQGYKTPFKNCVQTCDIL